MSVSIRWMRRSDTDNVSKIRECCAMGADLFRMLESPRCIIKVAEVEGEVAGFISYRNGRKVIKISEIAVAPGFRRRGIAKDLVRSVLSKIESSPDKRVEALVSDRLLECHILFRDLGFRAVKIVNSEDGSNYKFVKCQEKQSC